MQFQITFDALDPRSLSKFWASALGYVHPGPPGEGLSAGKSPFAAWDDYLKEIGVPEEQQNIAAAIEDPDQNRPRLTDLGATRVNRFEPAPPLSGGFIVMKVPEGNEFCLD